MLLRYKMGDETNSLVQTELLDRHRIKCDPISGVWMNVGTSPNPLGYYRVWTEENGKVLVVEKLPESLGSRIAPWID